MIRLNGHLKYYSYIKTQGNDNQREEYVPLTPITFLLCLKKWKNQRLKCLNDDPLIITNVNINELKDYL